MSNFGSGMVAVFYLITGLCIPKRNLIEFIRYHHLGVAKMVGMIGAVAILVWFYYSAEKIGKNPALWAIIGALSYAAARWGWTLGVIRPIMGRNFYSHSTNAGFWIEVTSIGFAIAIVVLIKIVFLRKAA